MKTHDTAAISPKLDWHGVGASVTKHLFADDTGTVDMTSFSDGAFHTEAVPARCNTRLRLLSTIQLLVGSACINLNRATDWPDATAQIQHAPLAARWRRRLKVSVSPKLRGTPDRVIAAQLLAPSGVYLSWLAMAHDESQRA